MCLVTKACVRCDRCKKEGPVASERSTAAMLAEMAGWVTRRTAKSGFDLCPDCAPTDAQRVTGGRSK